jgi:hypothetical protein
VRVSRETLRGWMRQAGLRLSRSERKRIQQPRHRRENLGELIQIDGSDHRWFEDRAAPCTLLVFIDDATSRLMELRFVASESTFAYFEALKSYLQHHGKPAAFYSDKHSIFRVSREDAARGHGMTQFGRALSELNIEILCANTSQAKDRVERAHHTLPGQETDVPKGAMNVLTVSNGSGERVLSSALPMAIDHEFGFKRAVKVRFSLTRSL